MKYTKMNIWKLSVNEGFNDAFLINESGGQCFEKDSFFKEIHDSPQVRNIDIRTKSMSFPDIMNYWGTGGTCIVNSKVKDLITSCFGNLSIQFIPCKYSKVPDMKMWLLNICKYHDVLDVENSVCRKMRNFEGKEVIRSVKKYVFKKDAFDFDIFKIYLSDRKYTTYLFVSDKFKSIMEQNNITGLNLIKVYEV